MTQTYPIMQSPHLQEIRGNAFVFIPKIGKDGLPTGQYLKFDKVKGVVLIPVSQVSKVRNMSRSTVMRKFKSKELHLYNDMAERLPLDHDNSQTKYVDYNQLTARK